MSASSINLTYAGSSHAMRSARFTSPTGDACVSTFATYQGRLTPPFRVTLRGIVGDLQSTLPSRSGNDKRGFRLYDSEGDFITCCAQGKICQSKAFENKKEVVIFVGCGRGPIGSDEGLVYAMKDSWVIPVSYHSNMPIERNQIHIESV